MHLTLHLTSRCNLRCRYCYATHAEQDMSLDTVKAAVTLARKDLAQRDPEQSLGIIFFGGEPLLMRGLIRDTMRYCRQVEAETGQLFHYKMTTNGMLLDEAFLTDPDTAECFIALSHDGVQAAHDMHRVDAQGNGSFAHLSPVVELLLRHKPYTPVMLVVTPETVLHYAESVQYLFTRGFHYLICSLNYAGAWDKKSFAELRRQYRKLATWYEAAMQVEEKFYFSPFEVKIASHIFSNTCRQERCELGKRQIDLSADSNVFYTKNENVLKLAKFERNFKRTR